jgi:hypothetical protein
LTHHLDHGSTTYNSAISIKKKKKKKLRSFSKACQACFLLQMPYSYHSHSGQFCKHGYGLLEDVVKEAIRKGFRAYGLSEHMPRYADSELYPEEIEVYTFSFRN